jgi:hypothetical protein
VILPPKIVPCEQIPILRLDFFSQGPQGTHGIVALELELFFAASYDKVVLTSYVNGFLSLSG